MSFYLLDTDTVSRALRGTAGVDERLLALEPGEWCISAVTRAELRYGLAIRPEATRLAELVEAFLAAALCMPWGPAAADHHGRVRARLRAAKVTIGAFDEMIAAHALSLDAVLVTGNTRHFGHVAGLRREDWLVRKRPLTPPI